MAEANKWLALSAAAEWLGVHPNTLRRWAEDGRVPYMLTPGGHRRFALRDLEALTDPALYLPATTSAGVVWSETALTHTRRELVGQETRPWLAAFEPEHRLEKRALGRRLMGILMQYVNGDGDQPALLAEARQVGAIYGQNAVGMEMPVATAISAALFFRSTLLQTVFDLPDSLTISSGEQRRLLGRLNEILNEVELAIAAAYQ